VLVLGVVMSEHGEAALLEAPYRLASSTASLVDMADLGAHARGAAASPKGSDPVRQLRSGLVAGHAGFRRGDLVEASLAKIDS
jgi:hypothetical protein